MRLEAGLHQRQEMRLRLAPQVIQSIELLQLPLIELQQMIKKELDENPTLEEAEPEPAEDSDEPGAAETAAPEAPPEKPKEPEPADDRLDPLREMEDRWREMDTNRPTTAGREAADRKMEVLANAPERAESLHRHLQDQLALLDETDARFRSVAEQVIYSISDDGYLTCTPEEIVDALPELFHDKPREEAVAEVGRILAVVQKLDPPGIAARDLADCLLRQLPEHDPDLELKRRLIQNHLEDIGNNRLPKVAADVAIPIEELNRVVADIRAMDAKPGAKFGPSRAPYIIPDVIVEEVDGRYEIRLEHGFLPQICISKDTLKLLQDGTADAQTKEFLVQKLEAGRRLISAIEQRRHTLHRIATEIVRVQQAFLDEGIAHLRPLKMQEVADALHIHVSTVSRAISEKYLQTPRGIFAMKFFFTGSAESTTGEAQSRVSVMSLIQELVGGEDKKNPLSDSDIGAELTKRMGLEVARRTVTKYRKALKIPSSRRRKQF